MLRRTGIAILLSLLVVLAGCAAVGGDSGDEPDSGDSGVASATGDDGGEVTDGEVTLVENRTAALRAAGGYTSVWQMEFSRDGSVVGTSTYTNAVDYTNERSLFSMLLVDEDEVSNDFEVFHADGTSYSRYGTGEEATYQVNDAPFEPENTLFAVQSYVADADDLADFDSRGTETYDGVTVTRFERTDRPNWVAAQGADEEFTWQTFTYTVLVDEDGLVRSEGWSGEGVTDDGVTQRMAFSFSLTSVGLTTVEDPDWFTAARDTAAL